MNHYITVKKKLTYLETGYREQQQHDNCYQ